VLAAGALAASPVRPPNAGDPGGHLAAGVSYQKDLGRAEQLSALAGGLGLENTVELSIRFGLSKPGVSTVLVGYSNIDQLEEAIRYADRGALSQDAVQQVLDLSTQ
jgi:aryl-alcohol dehydrogenase-like predicted oxidoreductase